MRSISYGNCQQPSMGAGNLTWFLGKSSVTQVPNHLSHPMHISLKYLWIPLSPTLSSVYLQQWHILWIIFIYSLWLPLSSHLRLHLPPQFTLFPCRLSLLPLHPLSFPLLSVRCWTLAAPWSVSIIVLEPLGLGLGSWTTTAFSLHPALCTSSSDLSSEQCGCIKALRQVPDPSMLPKLVLFE